MHQQALPGQAAKVYVADLAVGERVATSFLLMRCDVRTRQSGDAYLALQFSDKTGRISGRMWDHAEAAAKAVNEGEYVRVGGVVETWQSAPQIKVDRLEPAAVEDVDPGDYLPVGDRDPGEMYEELLGIVSTLENPFLKQLLEATFGDEEVAAMFQRAPGGVMLHHAYVGGLLEHTLSVVAVADRLAGHYATVDRDLLVTGACLHDLGKIWELAYGQAFAYTDEGRLVGHVVMEANWVSDRMNEIDGFPRSLRSHVLHLLASHHGVYEHGAPVQPITREALVLHYADDLDSKMGAMDIAIREAETTGADSVYSRSLGRKVLRRRWNEVKE